MEIHYVTFFTFDYPVSVSPELRKIHDMITITQPQIDAIRWAAERHVRSLKRSGKNDHEQVIKEIRGWIEALKNKKCQLSFLRLSNLLKMYPIKQLDISDFELKGDNAKLESMIQLVAQQTKTLNQIILKVHDARLLTNDFWGLDKLVNWLRVFERIDHFKLHYSRASTEMLELIASLPIKSLRVRADFEHFSLGRFIRTNKTIEHLEIPYTSRVLSRETLKALKENHTLKVSHFSYLVAD